MPSRIIAAFLVIVSLLGVRSAVAQNRFYEDDTSGFTLVAGVVKPERAVAYGGSAAFTLMSRVDIGLGYTKTNYDVSGLAYFNPQSTAVTPYVGFSVLRGTSPSRFGLDIAGNYSTVSFDGVPGLDEGHSYTVGADAYFRIQESLNLVLFPSLAVAYSAAETEGYDWYTQGRATIKTDGVLVAAELSMQFSDRYILTPGLSYFDESLSISLFFAIVFPNMR